MGEPGGLLSMGGCTESDTTEVTQQQQQQQSTAMENLTICGDTVKPSHWQHLFDLIQEPNIAIQRSKFRVIEDLSYSELNKKAKGPDNISATVLPHSTPCK